MAMEMKYATVCSGVEACTVAWEPLGWKPQWFSEIDKFPSAVLKHHYPDVPNLGDMNNILQDERSRQPIDLICGGTPCQSFSVAGLRKGLDDPRGNLALVFLGIVDKLRPEWVVWENVPGVLSSNGGRDFGAFVGALGQLGYGWAYRVLDAQYFGVPQRRRRVFVVGHIRDWRRAAAVLFERQSLSGNTPPSRKAREEIAAFTSGSLGGMREGVGNNRVFPTLDTHFNEKFGSNQWVQSEQFVYASAEGSEGLPFLTASNIGKQCNNQTPLIFKVRSGKAGGGKGFLGSKENAFTVATAQDQYLAFTQNTRDECRYIGGDGKIAGALGAQEGMKQRTYLQGSQKIRRLTPLECERLQGFPDNYTRIPYRNKPAENCPDGPRHKAMGNSMAVPVMRWIGQRIEQVNNLTT